MNCRSTGPLPSEFLIGREEIGIDHSGFTQEMTWILSPDLLLYTHLVGASPHRRFPTLSVTAIVQRKSLYWVVNGVVPFSIFSFLSLMCFCMSPTIKGPDEELAVSYQRTDHRAHMALVLVLTVATYRMAISGRIPLVSYFTELDRHMLVNSAYVTFTALWLRAFSMIVDNVSFDICPETIRWLHWVSFAVFGVLWLFMQCQATYTQVRKSIRSSPQDSFVRQREDFDERFRSEDFLASAIVSPFSIRRRLSSMVSKAQGSGVRRRPSTHTATYTSTGKREAKLQAQENKVERF